MKRIFIKSALWLCGLFFFLPGLFSQSSTQNYVLTRTMTSADGNKYQDVIQYVDGLGRHTQTVQKGVTPLKKDLVVLQEYDSYGRPLNQWLPGYGTGNGNYTDPSTLKTSVMTLNGGDTSPYSKVMYENSPLNRITQEFGPGMAWHQGSKSVKKEYLTNNSTTCLCLRYSINENNIQNVGNFADGELNVLKITDEDGNQSFEFKNKLGQILLTRQMNGSVPHNTYYIYDNQGNLACVLPPKLADVLSNEGVWAITSSDMDQLAYLYKYDNFNQCVGKKLPGADWIYYIYDKNNQLIFCQDGQLRLSGEWLYTFPDSLGRTVLSGICQGVKKKGVTLPLINSSFTDAFVRAVYRESGIYNRYSVMFNADTLLLTPNRILTTNYYDNYNYQNRNGKFSLLSYAVPGDVDAAFNTRFLLSSDPARSLLTGAIVSDIDTVSKVVCSAMYYDYRGCIIQNRSTNHLGGTETEYFEYNFMGKPEKRLYVHVKSGTLNPVKELYIYHYDHAGRIDTCTHQLSDGIPVKIAVNTYDELGRLKSGKKGTLAVTNYAYNVRSWIKSITNNGLFTETLYYNDSYSNRNILRFGGDISAMSWKLGSGNTNAYSYSYDGLSRLISANYLNNETYVNRYQVPEITYDKNGNITALKRYGKTTSGSNYGVVDNLTMTYLGNQLTKVVDIGEKVEIAESGDYKVDPNKVNCYGYNKNGALTKDLNKGIFSISYNLLNLPRQLDFSNVNATGNNVYKYLADGRKVKVTRKDASSPALTQTVDYIGNRIYENGVLKRILIEGGYIEDAVYHYYLNDHLGNVRVVVDSSGSIVQGNHYYPFGMTFAEASDTEQSIQPYKFNGKELDRMSGLNLYDYGARHYEPALGRFTTMDPLAEKYYNVSPYVYCGNNPINRIDPDGRDWYEDENGNAMWRRDQTEEYTDDNGKVWKNVGENYLWTRGDRATLFRQHTNKNGELYLRTTAYNLGSAQESSGLASVLGDILSGSSGLAGLAEDVVEGSIATFRWTDSKGVFDFKFYKNGWAGNLWVTPTKVADLASGVALVGRITGVLSTLVSGYQYSQATNIGDKAEHGLDVFMGGVGFVPVLGTGVSLYWTFGGKKLHYTWVDRVLLPQMKMSVNPGLPALQPFK